MFYRTDTDHAILIVYDDWSEVAPVLDEIRGSMNEEDVPPFELIYNGSPAGREIFRLRAVIQDIADSAVLRRERLKPSTWDAIYEARDRPGSSAK